MPVSLSGHTVLTIRLKALFDYFSRADIKGKSHSNICKDINNLTIFDFC